jgi:serine/threonine protein kinase
MTEANLGHYRLLHRLGAGGMGEVFLARFDRLGGFAKLVAIKRILPEFSNKAHFEKMFSAEASIAAKLNHPHIVQVTDFGNIEGSFFLAMEYVEGVDLATCIHKLRQKKIRVGLEFTLAVGLGCLRALGYAHRRIPAIIHGDVSPSNILVGCEGEVKLADFGLASLATVSKTSERQKGQKLIQGKLEYMPQEVASGKSAGQTSDLFGVGAVLFELICNQPLRQCTDSLTEDLRIAQTQPLPLVGTIRTDIDPELASIVDRSLAYDPQDRFGSAAQMEEALSIVAKKHNIDTGPQAIARLVNQLDGIRKIAAVGQVAKTLVALNRPDEKLGFPRRLVVLVSILVCLAIYGLWSLSWKQEAKKTEIFSTMPNSNLASKTPETVVTVEKSLSPRKVTKSKPAKTKTTRTVKKKPLAIKVIEPAIVEQEEEKEKIVADSYLVDFSANRPVDFSLNQGPFQQSSLRIENATSKVNLVKIKDELGLLVSIRLAPDSQGEILLALQSSPFAIVSIDGQPKGLTPIGKIRLPVGRHQLSFAVKSLPLLRLTLELERI